MECIVIEAFPVHRVSSNQLQLTSNQVGKYASKRKRKEQKIRLDETGRRLHHFCRQSQFDLWIVSSRISMHKLVHRNQHQRSAICNDFVPSKIDAREYDRPNSSVRCILWLCLEKVTSFLSSFFLRSDDAKRREKNTTKVGHEISLIEMMTMHGLVGIDLEMFFIEFEVQKTT